MTTTTTAPDERLAREDVVRLGLWMFLATVAMLFAAFTSAYIVRRSGSDWRSSALPSVLWLNTLVLGASSAAVEVGARSGLRGRWAAGQISMAAAVALGLAFLGGQAVAWRQLVRSGVYLPTNPRSSFYFMMTGAHAVHVVAALLVLVWATVHTCRGLGVRDPQRWKSTIGTGRTFWHFLGGVWIFLFAFMSNF